MGQKSSSKKRTREIQKRRKAFKKVRAKEDLKNTLIKLFVLVFFALLMIITNDLPFWEAQAPMVLIFVFFGRDVSPFKSDLV